MSLAFVVGTLVEFGIVLLIRRALNRLQSKGVHPNQGRMNKQNIAPLKVQPIQEVFIMDQNK